MRLKLLDQLAVRGMFQKLMCAWVYGQTRDSRRIVVSQPNARLTADEPPIALYNREFYVNMTRKRSVSAAIRRGAATHM